MKTYDDTVAFHGHSCPGLALGYRVALRALKEFSTRAADEELVAIVENNSCAVDAVQLMTGCTFGKGNLIFRDFGKQVYTFVRRPSGTSIRIAVVWKKPAETGKEKMMWKKYAEGSRSQEVIAFVHNRKAAKIKHILEAPDAKLLSVQRGKQKLPHEAEIFPSVVCSSCNEKVMEPRARIKNGLIVCIPCFGKSK